MHGHTNTHTCTCFPPPPPFHVCMFLFFSLSLSFIHSLVQYSLSCPLSLRPLCKREWSGRQTGTCMHAHIHSLAHPLCLTLSVSLSLSHSLCLSLSPLFLLLCVCACFSHSFTLTPTVLLHMLTFIRTLMQTRVVKHTQTQACMQHPPPPHTHSLTSTPPPPQHTLTHCLSLSPHTHTVTHPTHPQRMVTPLMACTGTPPCTTFPRSLKGDSTLPYC